MICTFFGHSDAPEAVKPALKAAIIELIEKENVTGFYVGNHGNFDRMTISILSELAKTRNIRFYVVLAYPPTEKDSDYLTHTVLPDGIETVPPRFAINYRNRFMIENADFVITYVTHSWGGAAKFKQLAKYGVLLQTGLSCHLLVSGFRIHTVKYECPPYHQYTP